MADPRLLVIVTLAFVLEAALGFGSSVIVATLGALLGPIDAVMPAFITVNLALSAWIAVGARAHIDRALLLRTILPAASLGLLVGSSLGRAADLPSARILFGVGVITLASFELRRELRAPSPTAPLSRASTLALLGAGGFVHGVFGAGGPLVVYAISRVQLDKAAFRATLSALWLVLNVALIARWASDGRWSLATTRAAVAFVPALFLGVALGTALFRRLPPRGFRATAAGVMAAAGASLAARSVVAMLRP